MQAHGRFEQEAWTYDERDARRYRAYVLMHERLVPYVRAAAATAARSGLPIMRPLCLTDPADPRGWEIADSYGYGPALWVAPVLEEGARARESPTCRAGTGSTSGPASGSTGGRWSTADAPLDRIPVWVRSGSIVVTYPAAARRARARRRPGAERAARGDAVGRAAARAGRAPPRRRHGDRLATRRVVGHAEAGHYFSER